MRALALALALIASPVLGQRMVPIQTDAPPPVVWQEVQAATSPVEAAAANAVRVQFSGAAGSGVYLGERLVATAYHVPRGTDGRGVVTFRDGTQIRCWATHRDSTWDQCVLELDAEHPSLTGVELSQYNPRAGEMVYSVGFGRGFRIFGGRVSGKWGSPGHVRTQTTDWFDHANPAVPGDSGGPVFNERGELIGCLWGTDGQNTTATGAGRFHVFVKPLFPRLQAWRAQRIANRIAGIEPAEPITEQQQCYPGGVCPPSYGGGRSTIIPDDPRPTPTPPAQAEIDYEKLIGLLLPRLLEDDRLRGPAGKDGTVTDAQLQTLTASLLVAIRKDPAFRGPPGADGREGPAGPPGASASLDIDALSQQVAARLKRRVMVVDGQSRKVLDDETYAMDEPILLDVSQLIKTR